MNTGSIRTVAIAVALPFAAFLALGVGVSAASAHDSVLSTTPGDTENLASAPSAVSVLFSDDVLDLGGILLVVDEHGTNWASGMPVLVGATASQAVRADMPCGDYQVRWRVVSADGHPISGTFDFGVGDADGVFTDMSAGASSASPSAVPAPESAPDSPRKVPVPLLGVAGAAIGLGVFSAVIFLFRRQRAQTSTRTPAGSTTSTTHTRSDTLE